MTCDTVYKKDEYNGLKQRVCTRSMSNCLSTIFWSNQDAKQAMHVQEQSKLYCSKVNTQNVTHWNTSSNLINNAIYSLCNLLYVM